MLFLSKSYMQFSDEMFIDRNKVLTGTEELKVNVHVDQSLDYQEIRLTAFGKHQIAPESFRDFWQTTDFNPVLLARLPRPQQFYRNGRMTRQNFHQITSRVLWRHAVLIICDHGNIDKIALFKNSFSCRTNTYCTASIPSIVEFILQYVGCDYQCFFTAIQYINYVINAK